MTAVHFELSDRYTRETAEVFMSGLHALARVPIEQLLVDRRNDLATAAYVSGYPGSPVGGFTDVLDEAITIRADLPITHQMALNEEYAATAVMGTQLAAAQPDARYQGVVGMWYGKAPGVDRALDALRHGSYAGASQHGGVVCIVGDDPGAKSSSLPSSSAGVLADLHIPVLYPGSPREALDLGRHAIALSRATGLWTALKIVADVADGTESVNLDLERVVPIIPTVEGQPYRHLPEGKILTPRTLQLEREIFEVRYPLSIEYARLNKLNHVTVSGRQPTVGIVASGITYHEVRTALRKLGLATDADIADVGLRLFKMLMPLPFDAQSVRDFATGLTEIIVIEEKSPNVETLIKDALYGHTNAPAIVGKFDRAGRTLFPGWGTLVGDTIAAPLYAVLAPRIGARLVPPRPKRERIPLEVERTPFYCSGCPHNRSTRVPDDMKVGVGIGCHSMVLVMADERVGNLVGLTPMGNEGMQWVGMAPYVKTPHFVQNLGDGTFYHSGRLAVGAAVAAGVNMTYKLLYNDAIGMTGGQRPTGRAEVASIVRQMLDLGVKQIVITTDDVENYDAIELPHEVEVWPRTRLDEAHRLLAQQPGVTMLVHDQVCAAEARRLRKRGLLTTPSDRIVINHRICEGCGHCGEVSNCLSVQPYGTEFGRKTKIDQTTCNFDYSCIEGDCPSFVAVDTTSRRLTRRRLRRTSDVRKQALREVLTAAIPVPPVTAFPDELTIRLTGIGGTGVVTVAQVLGTAAMLDGLVVHGLDQTGLSQKAGPVVSDLRLARRHDDNASRIGSFDADVLIALDQLVAASAVGLDAASRDTVVVGSNSSSPTGLMVAHPEVESPTAEMLAGRIAAVSRADAQTWADAAGITSALLGSAVTANVFVVGMAVQLAAVPLSVESVEQAIRMNGAAVESNLQAFALGRLATAEPSRLERAVTSVRGGIEATPPWIHQQVAALGLTSDTAREAARFAHDLVGYGNQAYAQRYLALVAQATDADRRLQAAGRFIAHVVRQAHHVMAYKDEYEVARLLLLEEPRAAVHEIAGDRMKVSFLLHPPVLRSLGVKRKIRFGEWTLPVFRVLAAMKRLRETPFDIFGFTAMRRTERRLRDEYLAVIEELCRSARTEDAARAVRIAALPDMVRGYEEIKMARVRQFDAELRGLMQSGSPPD